MLPESDILFFQNLMACFGISSYRYPVDEPVQIDQGFGQIIGLSDGVGKLNWNVQGNCIYSLVDAFELRYFALLPPCSQEILMVGPYLNHELTQQEIMALMEQNKIDTALFPSVMHSYQGIQVFSTEAYLLSAISTLAERLWGSEENFRLERIENGALLRISVENGGVHPLYIDRLSSNMAQKLEATASIADCQRLFATMVHKYCLLVKKHSMSQYSLLVQHVILRIEADLTADLSLKAHADFLKVNPSYLSSLFKRETGTTLTEYVNCQRVNHAIFLLNATEMQVQTIAQYCGIPDVNYFTKIFKKMVGKTPKEYRTDTRRSVT